MCCCVPQAVADQSGVEVQPTPHTMRVIQVGCVLWLLQLDRCSSAGGKGKVQLAGDYSLMFLAAAVAAALQAPAVHHQNEQQGVTPSHSPTLVGRTSTARSSTLQRPGCPSPSSGKSSAPSARRAQAAPLATPTCSRARREQCFGLAALTSCTLVGGRCCWCGACLLGVLDASRPASAATQLFGRPRRLH